MYYEHVGESRNTYKRHIFLNEMLSGQSKDYLDSIISHESERELEFDLQSFYLCLTGLPKGVYFDRYGVTANDMMLLYVTLEKEMVELWSSMGGKGEAILHLYGDKQIIFVFSFPHSTGRDGKAVQVAQRACERLQELYQEHFLRDGIYANVTLLSRELHCWEDIDPTLAQMREEWRRRAFFQMEARVWRAGQMESEPEPIDDNPFSEAIFQIRQAIRNGDGGEICRWLEELLLKEVKPRQSYYRLNDAMALLKEFERECITAYALKEGELDWVYDPQNYPTIEELAGGVAGELRALARHIQDKGVRYSPLVQKAMRVIQDHYASPDISLTFIAERLNISSAYLSSTFKKETGNNLTQCIKTARLRQAKKLLESTDLRIHEVAASVGFQDKRYFCAIFKQEEGVTPHQYRSQSV